MSFDPFDDMAQAARFKAGLVVSAVVLLALAALVIWYGEWRADTVRAATEQKYELAIGRLKTDAAQRLGEETRKVLERERELTAAQRRIEEMGRERTTIAAGYEKRLDAAAARNGGRLRDPAGCGGGGDGPSAPATAAADAGAGDAGAAGGLLSGPLSDLLRRVAREAQQQADAFAACRADALSVRQVLTDSP